MIKKIGGQAPIFLLTPSHQQLYISFAGSLMLHACFFFALLATTSKSPSTPNSTVDIVYTVALLDVETSTKPPIKDLLNTSTTVGIGLDTPLGESLKSQLYNDSKPVDVSPSPEESIGPEGNKPAEELLEPNGDPEKQPAEGPINDEIITATRAANKGGLIARRIRDRSRTSPPMMPWVGGSSFQDAYIAQAFLARLRHPQPSSDNEVLCTFEDILANCSQGLFMPVELFEEWRLLVEKNLAPKKILINKAWLEIE
jgi:hypothetical protein